MKSKLPKINVYLTFMKTSVKLLYLSEHMRCKNYIREENVGFKKIKLSQDENCIIHLKNEFAIVFVTNGEIKVSVPDEEEMLRKNEMGLFSNYQSYTLFAESATCMTILYFDRPNLRCDFLTFDSLSGKIDKYDVKQVRKLRMIKPVINFIKSMEFYNEKKMYFRHLHDLKEGEFFFLIRGFYPKEETAYFFTPVIRSLNDFANLVKTNYLKVDTVTELAEKLNMTPKTFTRRFKSVFDETPKQWMLKVKAKQSGLE